MRNKICFGKPSYIKATDGQEADICLTLGNYKFMTTFSEYFNIILTGDKEASRKAARQVSKLTYSSWGDGREKFDAIAEIVENAPKEYEKIKEDWRQENFVMAISVMYFLHNKREQPDFLFPWLFDLLQHIKGNIRYAAVRMLKNELGPLTVYIRVPDYELQYGKQGLSPKQADAILYELYFNLNKLIGDLWKPNYKRYKYIESLPSGPYKSVQMVLGTLEEYCGEDYMIRFMSIKQDKNTLYYDALDLLNNGKEGARQALKFLVEALEIDSDYVQTYIGLVSVYDALGKDKEMRECIKQAFEKTKKQFSKWPETMPWGALDNRAYMRAIQYMGDDLADSGDKDGAIELYKLLLKMNPNDNQGVRYTLAGLYAGISGSEINEMFDEGNKKQDWSKLEELVDTQNKKNLFWKKPQ